jgi:hypothetical protein
VASLGTRPERTMTAAESTALTQLSPLAKQFLQNRANEITGHYDNTAGIPMWTSQAVLTGKAATELRTEGDTLLMDDLDYETSGVSTDQGMVQIVGNQANVWFQEQTTLAMPGGTLEEEYAHTVDRAFIFVRSGTTWALAGQRLVSDASLPPMTEPLTEFVPAVTDWSALVQTPVQPGTETDPPELQDPPVPDLECER